jgi:hypothetical protein
VQEVAVDVGFQRGQEHASVEVVGDSMGGRDEMLKITGVWMVRQIGPGHSSRVRLTLPFRPILACR